MTESAGRRNVDLHTHTSASDGTDTPEELVRKVAELGLVAVAVTDHDTISGLDEACVAGKRYGVAVVRGCELAVGSRFGELHILGLWLSPKPSAVTEALAGIREGRDARNREMVDRFRAAGYDVCYEELLAMAKGESVARPHMARLLVTKGICVSVSEAFSRFLGTNKPMAVPRVLPSPEEVFTLLRSAGATTVFAHPMLVRAPYDWLRATTSEFVDMGLDAVEAYHPDHDAKAVRKAEKLARYHGLALSGGSDYHGDARPETLLGRGSGGSALSYSLLEGLLACRKRKNQPLYMD